MKTTCYGKSVVRQHRRHRVCEIIRDRSEPTRREPTMQAEKFNTALASLSEQARAHRETLAFDVAEVRLTGLTPRQRMFKRAFDFSVALTVLLLILPVLAVIALAIKLDSEGPVFFKQVRIGENGKPFKMYKFRSMVVNAEKLQAQINQTDIDGNTIHKMRNDPRVTRVGRIIRKTSLDELPQFINVLIGNMSLVGPRPELPWLVEEYEPWQRQRFAVPQGITGWWQVNGRSDKPCHLNTDQDIYYIQNYSFALDIKILLMTVPALVQGKGAF
ncbi:sugar transferase [bacterium]|nr:sugar transferase [bacterium]